MWTTHTQGAEEVCGERERERERERHGTWRLHQSTHEVANKTRVVFVVSLFEPTTQLVIYI